MEEETKDDNEVTTKEETKDDNEVTTKEETKDNNYVTTVIGGNKGRQRRRKQRMIIMKLYTTVIGGNKG